MEILSTQSGAFHFTVEAQLGIQILGPKPWLDKEFFEFVKAMEELALLAGDVRATLNILTGPMPNATQRRFGADIAHASARENLRIAVMIDSPVQKTILTAFTWLTNNKNLHAFPKNDFAGALMWLSETARFDAVKVEAIAREMMRRAGYDPT